MMWDSFEAGRVMAFVITIVTAQLIAMALFRASGRSARLAQRRAEEAGRAGHGLPPAAGSDNAFLPAVLRQMETLAVPVSRRQQVAAALSSFLHEQLEQQVRAVTEELSQQYGQAVKDKTEEAKVVRQQYEQTLAQKEQTEAVMRSLAEGVVVVNAQGDVVFVNPAAEKILGVDKREKLGKPLAADMKDEQILSLVKGGDGQGELEVELSARQDQTRKIVRSSNAVVEDESGKTIGMVSVLTDVTKQKELDRMKSEFVSGVTHEIRTPIVAIQHSLAVMQDQAAGDLSDAQKNFVSIAQRNLERLSDMVNDLLDLAKLEAKKVELKPQRASIIQVIRQTCETMGAWAKSKGIQLQMKVQDTFPEFDFDPGRIEQVLTNLVGNALKFTPKNGSVTIEAQRAAEGDEVEIRVVDTGPGIAGEDLPKLFKKFQQVGDRAPGEAKGTGLGLAIAKELVELHKGTIRVESESGKGARVIFTLPLAPTAVGAPKPKGGSADGTV